MRRLGYDSYGSHGSDAGTMISRELGLLNPPGFLGLHVLQLFSFPSGDPAEFATLQPKDYAALEHMKWFQSVGGYNQMNATRPQTVAYGLADSPVGQATWIYEKFQAWTDNRGNAEDALRMDQMLDDISIYWFTDSAASSARFYWENFPPPGNDDVVAVPTAVTIFPADIEKLPRRWVEQRFSNLTYWNVVERGGHFPMLEVPSSYARELQRSLGSMTFSP
jgi:pimeloyl-ACP methyl ester carboxylesterase